MTLLRPESLVWGLLAIPLVVLYLRRDRIPRHIVAAGSLWQQVLAERTARARWRRWRRLASLAAQLAILFALVLAMAEPAFVTANVGQAFQPDSVGQALRPDTVGQAFQPVGNGGNDGDNVRLESLTYASWWPYLAVVAVVVLVVEWRLFQRRWTC
jgi:hypothetical protein